MARNRGLFYTETYPKLIQVLMLVGHWVGYSLSSLISRIFNVLKRDLDDQKEYEISTYDHKILRRYMDITSDTL